IFKVGKEPQMPRANKSVKFPGKVALPGVIDVHVHLRDQELSYKETFETGTMAAAVGGVTTVLDMPNNRPVTNSAKRIIERMKLAEGRIYVNVGFYSALPKRVDEIDRIVEAGAVAFKVNLCRQIGEVDVDDDEQLLEAINRISLHNLPISIHAENRSVVISLEEQFKEMGRHDIMTRIESHPASAEVSAVARMISLAKKANAKLHFAHISTADAIELIRNNRSYVTCEVTPHHLYLTREYARHFRGIAIMEPPLRTKRDLKALWKGIRDGVVDVVASDHAPHALSEKEVEDIWKIKPGIPGLETLLPLMLNAVMRNWITLAEMIKVLCINPAKIFRLKGKGLIKEGYDADITVVDFKVIRRIDSSRFKSKAKYSPFNGFEVKGWPTATIISGTIVAENDEVIEPAGRILGKPS
ncbi:MAG: dihydroorotase, partial [Thermoprotei archaeon]